MGINIIDDIEEVSEINLDWFYHSIPYNKNKYSSILTEGIKCNDLLDKPGCGVYNGKYYISLSKITIPDNLAFQYYVSTTLAPSFIMNGIEPIKCKSNNIINRFKYEKYIDTKDSRRMGSKDGEYQYYYFIQSTYIIGIVYNLLKIQDTYPRLKKSSIVELAEIILLLEELDIDIPIYDYSRRDKVLVHEINKEKIKYYSRKLYNN